MQTALSKASCLFYYTFMTKKMFSKSQRIFIRREKARIRRQFLDIKKQKQEIEKIYQKYDNSRNIQSGN